jgi:hypothetical protein
MNDTLDCLQSACVRLAQEGAIKDRLIEAYATHLFDVDSHHLPESVRADFEALHEAMHSAVPQPRECVIRASVRKMSIPEVRAHAALVVKVFSMLARSESETIISHRTQRVPSTAPVVALFAEA